MSNGHAAIANVDEFAKRLQKAILSRNGANGTATHDPQNGTRGNAVAPAVGGDPATWGPIGQGPYVVQGSDCMSSLAARTGHLWQTIWEDAANSELRTVRLDPNVLAVGDRVTIPPLRQKTELGQTELRHRFVRLGQPTVFQLRLAVRDRPLALRTYTIRFDSGEEFAGATNDEGFLRCQMPSQARRAALTVADGDQPREYELRFGRLEPVDHLLGVQQRLRNLGFFHGAETGSMDDKTRQAIEYYQQRRGLPRTGVADDATRKRIQQEHGS